MKKLLSLLLFITAWFSVHAQAQALNSGMVKDYTTLGDNVMITESNMHRAAVPLYSTTHFVSPEDIEYVDISSPDVHGDMPEKNIFRLKADTSAVHVGDNAIITIVTKSFISVYKIYFTAQNKGDHAYVLSVNPNESVQTNQAEVLNNQQCFNLSLKALKEKRSIFNVKTKSYGMDLWINNIYTIGNYILVDLEAKNNSKIQFNVDQLRFKVIDKRLVKATVSQDIEFKPIYSLYPTENKIIKGKGEWRNFYIFKKFTFPTQKLFSIEMNEEQYSGRRIELKMEYNQLLKSETLN